MAVLETASVSLQVSPSIQGHYLMPVSSRKDEACNVERMACVGSVLKEVSVVINAIASVVRNRSMNVGFAIWTECKSRRRLSAQLVV